MTAGFRFIQIRKDTVQIHIRLFIVGYICQATRGSHWIHLLWREFVLRLCHMTTDCPLQNISVLIHFVLPGGTLLSLGFSEFDYWHRKGLCINHVGRHVIDDVWLRQSFLLCTFYKSLKDRALKDLRDWSIDDGSSNHNYLHIRAWFRSKSCIAE